MRFVENYQVRAQFLNEFDIFKRQFIAGQREKRRRGVDCLTLRQRSVDHLRSHLGELLDFGLPLILDGGGRDNQHPLDSFKAAQKFSSGQRLNRLPKAHIVGEYDAPAAGGEQRAARLIWQELCFQNAGRRILSAFEFREQADFHLQAFGELVFAIEIFQHIAIDDGLIVSRAEGFQQFGKLPVALAPQ